LRKQFISIFRYLPRFASTNTNAVIPHSSPPIFVTASVAQAARGNQKRHSLAQISIQRPRGSTSRYS
jgi:hypothetical protein